MASVPRRSEPLGASGSAWLGMRPIVRRTTIARSPTPGFVARRMVGLGRQLGMRQHGRVTAGVSRLPDVRFPDGVWAMAAPDAEPDASAAADPVMAAIRARYQQKVQRRYEPPKRGLPSSIRRGVLTKAGTTTGPASVVHRMAPADALVAKNDGHFSPAPKRSPKPGARSKAADEPGPRAEPPTWSAARAAEAFTHRLAAREGPPSAEVTATRPAAPIGVVSARSKRTPEPVMQRRTATAKARTAAPRQVDRAISRGSTQRQGSVPQTTTAEPLPHLSSARRSTVWSVGAALGATEMASPMVVSADHQGVASSAETPLSAASTASSIRRARFSIQRMLISICWGN